MPCLIKLLSEKGLESAAYEAESLAAAAQFEPEDGVYTITNTYQTDHVIKLDAHLDRLEDSARRESIPLALDRPRLRAALRQMIAEADFGSVRFRVTVPRQANTLILSIEPYHPPSPEFIEKGVRCVTVNMARHHPEAKTTDWMHARQSIQDSLPPGIYDAFLTSEEGLILEGLGSNFYAVLKGELWTADSGVLKGIARMIVLETAPSLLPVRLEAAHRRQIPDFDEAFLTSSSRGIIPVIEIDGISFGGGSAGPKTKALQAAYGQWVEAHLERL